jgi:arylsulfatase A-like enzyme
LGLYGYPRATTPHLDRWFGSGAVYLRTYSTSASTAPSVVSLLTGLYPRQHRVRLLHQLLSDRVTTVTEHLPADYARAAFVSNVVLTDEAIGLAGRFDHYDDFVDEKEPYRLGFERTARRTTDAALRWIGGRADPRRPVFLWVHYIDPHGPYLPPERWRSRFDHPEPVLVDPLRVPRYQRDPAVSDGLEYVDRYDEEIAYADAEIGRLLDGLARLRPLDDALVVFTADHGETMMETDTWFDHGHHVREPLIRVPLLVRGPGVEPGRFEVPVSGIDIAPTLLRFAGAEVPDAFEGADLRRGSAVPPDRTLFATATKLEGQWRAAIRGDRKWVLRVRGVERVVSDMATYDLASDPHEARPRPWKDGEVARRLLERVRTDPDPAGLPLQLRRGIQLRAPKVAPGASPEMEEKLRALGYVE